MNINTDTILFFDMDGTLVETDFANFLAYKKAIQLVTQTENDISYKPNERFSRVSLKEVAPNLTDSEYERIIQQKENNYKEYLSHTKLNKSVAEFLIKYSKTNKTVLVTNCREERALMTLEYHKLIDKFSNMFFKQFSDDGKHINKYKNAMSILSISPENVVVFENEKQEIQDAILAGIPIKNIITF